MKNLKRKIGLRILIILGLVIFTVGVLLGVNICAAEKKYVIRIAGSSAPDIRAEAINYMIEELPKATDGLVEMKAYYASMGGEKEILERVTVGTLEAYMGSTGILVTITGNPLSQLYDVPYLFKDWDHLYKVAMSEVGEKFNQILIEKGVRILDYVSMGNRAVYFKKQPIHSPADLKDLKIRVMENPVYQAMYREFGAIPVPMSWTEIYIALQTGVLDGVDGSLSSGLASKHSELVKYVSYMGNHVVISSILAVSEEWYQKLPDDLRQKVEKVFHEAASYERKKNEEYQAKLEQEWIDAGVEFTEVNRTEFENVARRIYPMVEKEIGADIIQKVVKMGE